MEKLIEEAIRASIQDAVKRIVVRKMYSQEIQNALEAEVHKVAAEVMADPEFKVEVRKLLLKALQTKDGLGDE